MMITDFKVEGLKALWDNRHTKNRIETRLSGYTHWAEPSEHLTHPDPNFSLPLFHVPSFSFTHYSHFLVYIHRPDTKGRIALSFLCAGMPPSFVL